ncbi:aspartic proteinase PCS1-like [Oryza brachyantha]|uniref:aspartic proteinase PCS1-like n=1 Tax=Oryza brachyantha TaxID=4533 RepID=UPI001ADA64D7|nr:aspartic proteinase PCS1-like [Oryza brachyantha]
MNQTSALQICSLAEFVSLLQFRLRAAAGAEAEAQSTGKTRAFDERYRNVGVAALAGHDVMEAFLVLLCLYVFLARAEAASGSAGYAVGGGGGEGKSPGGTVLPLRVREVEAPAANRLRFRHNVRLTVPVAVGTPPQNVTMVLDTGSELSWLLCNGSCAPPLTPAFNASGSASYDAVPCLSPACEWRGRDLPVPPSCGMPPSNACRVSLSYADASSADGVLAADTFLLGGAPPVGNYFGCITSYSSTTATNSNATDTTEEATGLLGMNRGTLSFVTQTGTRRFAYCISPGEGPGVLLLGDDGGVAPPLNYTPLIEISQPLPYFDRVAYSVQLEGIRVGYALLPIPKSALTPDHTGAGQTMVDSGTQFTFLLADAYAALKDEFLNQTRLLLAPLGEPEFVFQGAFDACFRGPEARMAAASELLPEVGLVLRGAEVAVAGEKLLYMVPGERRGEGDAEAVWCLTFGNSDMAGMSAYVIGHHHQQNVWVEYDLQNGRVGFAPARCDLATERLGAGA